MLYLGIDWSQDHHDVCFLNEAGQRMSQLHFEHSLEGFEQIEHERARFGLPPAECLVAIETSYNPIVDFLLDYGYPIYIIPPQATAAYRPRRSLSGAHTDSSDADLLAGILRTDRAHHRRLQPNLPLTQHLAAQVRLVQMLKRSTQRHTNQLRAVLVRTYPQAVHWFSRLTVQVLLEFLAAYPTLSQAQALSRDTFEAFMRQHGYKRPAKIAQRFAALHAAWPVAGPAAIAAYEGQIAGLAQVLLTLVHQTTQAESSLTTLFGQHPDAALFASLPGAGDLLAPALLVKFGDHRDRFATASGVQALAGTCPVTEASGKRCVIKFRYGCDKEFRHIVQQFARASIQQSGWAAGYWREVRPTCSSDSHAYRIVANRWLAILWKMWQDRKPYDESYHVKQRAQRRTSRR